MVPIARYVVVNGDVVGMTTDSLEEAKGSFKCRCREDIVGFDPGKRFIVDLGDNVVIRPKVQCRLVWSDEVHLEDGHVVGKEIKSDFPPMRERVQDDEGLIENALSFQRELERAIERRRGY